VTRHVGSKKARARQRTKMLPTQVLGKKKEQTGLGRVCLSPKIGAKKDPGTRTRRGPRQEKIIKRRFSIGQKKHSIKAADALLAPPKNPRGKRQREGSLFRIKGSSDGWGISAQNQTGMWGGKRLKTDVPNRKRGLDGRACSTWG